MTFAASAGSTEASESLPARVGVVGPTRAGRVGGGRERKECLILAGDEAPSRHGDLWTTRLYDRRRKKVARKIVERISICTDLPSPGFPHDGSLVP
jgi:hypothetical protein